MARSQHFAQKRPSSSVRWGAGEWFEGPYAGSIHGCRESWSWARVPWNDVSSMGPAWAEILLIRNLKTDLKAYFSSM